MAADSTSAGRQGATRAQRATFDLERFSWGTPDRLEVSGTFAGIGEAPGGEPVLLVRAADREVRLPALAETVTGPPADARPWQAHFAWQEAPFAFEAATLAIGEDMAIDLPEPGTSRPRFRRRPLEVRFLRPEPEPRPDAEPEREPDAPATPPETPADEQARVADAPASNGAAASMGIEHLRLQAELLAAQEQVREMAAALERANEELTRASGDLAAEREHRGADAQRFREGLAKVSGSVEEAVAGERGAADQLHAELSAARDALAQRDTEVADLRRQTEAAQAARDEAEAHAASLRDRIDELEQASAQVEELRTELQRARGQTEAALAGLAAARTATAETRADAARLLSGLTTIVEALGPRE